MPKVYISLLKKFNMAEIHYSIPGLEHVLHRIACEDKAYRVFFSCKLTKDLAKKYYTATAFFSLNGDKEVAIYSLTSLISSEKPRLPVLGRPIIRTLIKQSFTHE